MATIGIKVLWYAECGKQFAMVCKWPAMTTNDVGSPLIPGSTPDVGNPLVVPAFADMSIQAEGTWSGSTLTLQCSNVVDNLVTNSYETDVDIFGTATILTADGKYTIATPSYAKRPAVTGGSGTIDVYAYLRGER